jgi:hypothetical protein
MRDAWPYAPAPRFLLFDHDSKFGKEVVSSVKGMGSQPVRTAFRVHGRTGWRSVGWEVAGGNCWTTSSS